MMAMRTVFLAVVLTSAAVSAFEIKDTFLVNTNNGGDVVDCDVNTVAGSVVFAEQHGARSLHQSTTFDSIQRTGTFGGFSPKQSSADLDAAGATISATLVDGVRGRGYAVVDNGADLTVHAFSTKVKDENDDTFNDELKLETELKVTKADAAQTVTAAARDFARNNLYIALSAGNDTGTVVRLNTGDVTDDKNSDITLKDLSAEPKINVAGGIVDMVFRPQTKSLYVISATGVLRVIDMSDSSTSQESLQLSKTVSWSHVVSLPQAGLLVIGKQDGKLVLKEVVLFPLGEGNQVDTSDAEALTEHPGDITNIVVDNDSGVLLLTTSDGQVHMLTQPAVAYQSTHRLSNFDFSTQYSEAAIEGLTVDAACVDQRSNRMFVGFNDGQIASFVYVAPFTQYAVVVVGVVAAVMLLVLMYKVSTEGDDEGSNDSSEAADAHYHGGDASRWQAYPPQHGSNSAAASPAIARTILKHVMVSEAPDVEQDPARVSYYHWPA